MKRIIKISFVTILILTLYQTVSYFAYGKRKIEICYYEHFSPLIKDINNLNVQSKTELTYLEKQEIKEILASNYNVISFSEDTIKHEKDGLDKEITTLGISVNYEFPFHAVVYENLRTENYIEVWKSELNWFMGKWILKQRINIGQT